MTHQTRTTVVVGRIGPEGRKVARKCAWCLRFYEEEDRILARLGRPVSDGICGECAEKWFPDDGPEAA